MNRRAERHAVRGQSTRSADALPDDVENELIADQADAECAEQPQPGRKETKSCEHDSKPYDRNECVGQQQRDGGCGVGRLDSAQRDTDLADIDRTESHGQARDGRTYARHGTHAESFPGPGDSDGKTAAHRVAASVPVHDRSTVRIPPPPPSVAARRKRNGHFPLWRRCADEVTNVVAHFRTRAVLSSGSGGLPLPSSRAARDGVLSRYSAR